MRVSALSVGGLSAQRIVLVVICGPTYLRFIIEEHKLCVGKGCMHGRKGHTTPQRGDEHRNPLYDGGSGGEDEENGVRGTVAVSFSDVFGADVGDGPPKVSDNTPRSAYENKPKSTPTPKTIEMSTETRERDWKGKVRVQRSQSNHTSKVYY